MWRLGKGFQIIREIVSLTKGKLITNVVMPSRRTSNYYDLSREEQDELKVKNHPVLDSPYTYA